MSKKLLQKHLVELQKEHLEIMVLDLYDKFPEVKTYFNFVFTLMKTNC
ncbi:conserved hypothetical protein [Flavobacteria bacterium MS024-3C]|nr:conserved hypothetical protein [Flavobacteria bacterium MS024-3C]